MKASEKFANKMSGLEHTEGSKEAIKKSFKAHEKKEQMAKKIKVSQEPKGHGQFEHVNRPMTHAEKWGKKKIK